MTKKRYSYLVLLMLASIGLPNAYAQKTISGSKELPLEMNLLVESLQNSSAENFDKIQPLIMNIDLYARSLSKEDIFLLGKIEVYKTLLKNYATPIKAPVDGLTVSTLRSAIAKTDDNFTKWFLQALLKDSIDLTGSPVYKEFLLQKNSNAKIEKVEYRKMEKKAELIQFWVSKLSSSTNDIPDTFKNELNSKMMDALKNIQNSFYLMAKEATIGTIASPLKNDNELKFFSIKEAAPVKAKAPEAAGQKSVEDILAPITGSDISPQDLPKPTNENWLEEENAPPSMQNLPKPTLDADWLQDF